MSNPYVPQGGNAWGGYPQGQPGDPYAGQGQQGGYGGYPQGAPQQGGYPGQYAGQPQAGYGQGQPQAFYGVPVEQGGYGGYPQGAPQQGGKSKTPLIVGIVASVVVVALVAGAAVWMLSGSGASDPSAGASPSGSSSPSDNSSPTAGASPRAGSSAPSNGNNGSSGGMYKATPEGSNSTYEITDISLGPTADQNEQTMRVVFRVTNNGTTEEFAGMYPHPYQNNEQLTVPNFFTTKKPSDFEYTPGNVQVKPGETVEYVGYWVIKDKKTAVEFRDANWMINETKGKKQQYWTWQPK